jgi:2'-5' RNA ligase
MSTPAEMMRSHWWWRPGWRRGRSFYTWHLTFAEDRRICDYASQHAPIIGKFETLDQVNPAGLHVTLQGIGFADEVERSQVEDVVEATRPYISRVNPFNIEVGPVGVDEETVQAPVHPISPIADLRNALRQGIGVTLGEEAVPETTTGFRPHLTLAYSNGTYPVNDVAAVLNAHKQTVARATVSTVSLINLNRDQQRYEWSTVSTLELGRLS